ncbi:MAG: RNA polymerase subunit sigma-24, partial [Firmicutes bacterium HGW-Firmicutes-13]
VSVDLEQLVKDLWPEIYRFIYYKVQNKEEAEELTQDTFKRVLPKIQTNKVEEDKLKAYVFQAARNLLKDLWRRRSRNPKMVNLEEVQNSSPFNGNMEDEYEEKMVITQAMTCLSHDYQNVLTLRIVEGYSVKEAAELMGRTTGAVRSLQHRAVQSLKELLEERGFFND